MLPEEQQRIMGYFIEEAKDHLNTIEQGLLNLQATITDPEKANEVFRAAHSVKGGAAMLSLESIQKTAHRMEDYFKILKESPVQVDRTLETMFLRISDGLKDLLEQLEGPFGLTAEKAQEIMADVDPVFGQLESHLQTLVAAGGNATAASSADSGEQTLQAVFKPAVGESLREMLTIFKQGDSEESRAALQTICDRLLSLGEQLKLHDWCDLIGTAKLACGHQQNDYRSLAPVLIKEIKQAQDLVLANRASEVGVSEKIQALIPDSVLATPQTLESDLATENENINFSNATAALEQSLEQLEDAEDVEDSASADLFESIKEMPASDETFDDLFGAGVGADSLSSNAAEDYSGSSAENSKLGENDSDFDELFSSETPELDDLASLSLDLDSGPNSSTEHISDEPPIERLSVELDFNEIPSELSELNRSDQQVEAMDESLDALSTTINVTGPDIGTDELNSLADLFDGDLDELDNTLGGHAFVTEEMRLNPEKIDMSVEDDFTDLLSHEAENDLSSEMTTDGAGDFEEDLFGGTLTDEGFASPADLSLEDDLWAELETAQSDAVTVEENALEAESSAATDDLTDDLWGDADDKGNLFGSDDDNILGSVEISSPALLSDQEIKQNEINALDLDALDFDSAALEPVSEEELSQVASTPDGGEGDFEDVFTPDELEGLDLEEGLDDAITDNTASQSSATTSQHDETNKVAIPNVEGTEDDLKNVELPPVSSGVGAVSMLSDGHVSPSEHDIEFPTLTGSKLAEAEKDIDSFFGEDDLGLDEQLDTTSLAEDNLNQLDDEPWGELSLDTLGGEFQAFADTTEALSETEELSAQDTSEQTELSPIASEDSTAKEITSDRAGTEDIQDEVSEQTEDVAEDIDFEDIEFDDLEIDNGLLENNVEQAGSIEDLDALFGVEDAAQEASDISEQNEANNSADSLWDEIDIASEADDFSVLEALETGEATDSGSVEKVASETDTISSADELFEAFDLPDVKLPSSDSAAVDQETRFSDEFITLNESNAVDTAQLSQASDSFDDLDALLSDESDTKAKQAPSTDDEFDDLESLLSDDNAKPSISEQIVKPTESELSIDDDFGDLERLLEDSDGGAKAAPAPRRAVSRPARKSGGVREQNMRVPVKHLDNLSNLVGELVVNRNTLERDQERLRQFLDNLLFQVQQLNDVGQRMRDLYERSLLESSLVSNRRAYASDSSSKATDEDHATGATFDALEMDRFTGFHTLSQEMIELIVRVRESSSDIGYTVESADQVTRQFRQITTQLQEGLNTARMVAFSQAADRLPRAVRDISLKCGKEAQLIVDGKDTLIDKMIVEHLYDPLTHLVNNAITHGIETPEERRAAGKPSEGTITVQAFYQGNQTVLYVADDGAGINPEFVKRKAIEKKLITKAEAEQLSDNEAYELIFHAGFSTRDQADDFAGRGVGMDVVRTSLAEIRGAITIDSEMGKGTSFTIRLPLTLSISKALSCVSNQARIAFPMDGVEDMLDVPCDRVVKNDQDQDCIRWRDKVLPFQPVTELLKFNRTMGRGRVYGGSQTDDILSIIVLRSANNFVAIQVDQVIGEEEIVIKQLEGPVPKPLGIAGATILGDGRVMPIADVIELMDLALGRVRRESTSMMWNESSEVEPESSTKSDPTVLIVDDSITVRELLSMSFNKVGYRVEQARDGQEAWDKLRSGLPCDLVFCDIEMPRMDGLELLSRMQKDNQLKRVPIAMLTSRGADRHRQMAVDLGASGYFTKPYLEEALLDAAQRMLNGETLAKGRGG